MFDEKQLRNLQKVNINQVDKQADFEKVEQRQSKKTFYWQVPTVAFSALFLLLFLLVTVPLPNNHVQVSSEPYITEILFHDGEGDPKSTYYLRVERTIDSEALQMIQNSVDSFTPVQQPPEKLIAHKAYRIKYSDGSYRVLNEYFLGQRAYFKDVQTGNYYELEDGNRFILLSEKPMSEWQIIMFFVIVALLFGGNTYIDKKMRVEGDPQRKLPMHSHTAQSLVTFFYMLVTISFFLISILSTLLLHIGWIYVFGIIMALINIKIEQKYDNNSWRKLRFIYLVLMIPTYLFLFLQL